MAQKRASGLPVARRAPAGSGFSLLAPVPVPGYTTSTPARSGSRYTLPAPMPTPHEHFPALLEPDSTFFGALQSGNGRDDGDGDETALLALDYGNKHAGAAQDTFIGETAIPEAELAETTVMLQQRAFANNNSLAGGLGGKLFEMLMSQSVAEQPLAATTARGAQDVLLSIDVGNSQLGKGRRSNSPVKPRTSIARRNERSSIGPSGQSFVDFDTDVRFGDDLLGGGGSKEPSPELVVPVVPPFSFRNFAPIASTSSLGSSQPGAFGRLETSVTESANPIVLERERASPGHGSPGRDAGRGSLPLAEIEAAEASDAEPFLPVQTAEVDAAKSQVEPVNQPTRDAGLLANSVSVLAPEKSARRKSAARRRPSSSSVSSVATRTSPRKPRISLTASTANGVAAAEQPPALVPNPSRRRSRETSLRMVSRAVATVDINPQPASPVEEAARDIAVDTTEVPQTTTRSPQGETEAVQHPDLLATARPDPPAAEAGLLALSEGSPVHNSPGNPIEGVSDNHSVGPKQAARIARDVLPISDDNDVFSSIASSPQVDRSRRRRPVQRASIAARHPFATSTNLSPVVEEKSASRSRISLAALELSRRASSAEKTEAAPSVPTEAAEVSLVQSKIQEMHAELSRVFAMRNTSMIEEENQAEAASPRLEEEEELPAEHHKRQKEIDTVLQAESAARLLPTELLAAAEINPAPRESAEPESDDEVLRRPILLSFLGDVPEIQMQSPARPSVAIEAAPKTSTSVTNVQEHPRTSVFDRLAPATAPRERMERPLSTQSSHRPRSRQSTAGSLAISKPYDRPSSRTSIRSEVPTVATASTRATLPMRRPPRPGPVAEAHSVPKETEVRGRTVSVPVKFSPKPRPQRMQRQKRDDDMFSRRQRDGSRGRGIEPESDASRSRPASRSESCASVRSGLSQQTRGTASEDRAWTKAPVRPAAKAAPTRPAEFRFAQTREKRKRDHDADVPLEKLSRPVAKAPQATVRAVAADFQERCQKDDEALEDEIIVPLTAEALKAQDQINESRQMERSANASGVMQDLDKTAKSETLQRYLEQLSARPARVAEEVRSQGQESEGQQQAAFAAHGVETENIEAGRAYEHDAGPQPKRAKRLVDREIPIETAKPRHRAAERVRPHRLHELPAHKREKEMAKAAVKPANSRPTGITVSQPFSFRTSTREQASFTDRLAVWHQREQEAAASGRPALAPLPVPLANKTVNAASRARVRMTSGEKREPVKVKEFQFASDARMKERREFEERLKEKERILAELESVRRAEQELRDAAELKRMRAAQIPRAHPVPQFYYDRH